MTSSTPQHVRSGPLARRWRAFRAWRRSRPFWGGLFTVLAGLEIFATTQGSLGGLTFHMGPTGFLSWLIPTILVACGLLMWFTPGQRVFYSVVAAVTAVFSLIGVNLGGFLVGLLLGMVGSALGFAWARVAASEPDVPSQRRSDVDVTAEIPVQRSGPAKLHVVALVLLSLTAAGAVTLHGGSPAHAAPCGTPAPSAPGDESEEDGGGNFIEDILDGIGDLFGIGGKKAPAPSPSPSEPAAPACPPQGGGEEPGGAEPGGAEPAPIVTRVVDPPADIKAINRIPSIQTGSKLTNYNLEYHGVTDLPVRGGGTMKVLWFNMTRAVTDDFELRPAVPGNRRMSVKADPLTVEGRVRFFTPRFTGKLLGIPQVYTPSSPPPLPPGLAVPLPLVFTEINIQLAYVDCAKLTGNDLLNTP